MIFCFLGTFFKNECEGATFFFASDFFLNEILGTILWIKFLKQGEKTNVQVPEKQKINFLWPNVPSSRWCSFLAQTRGTFRRGSDIARTPEAVVPCRCNRETACSSGTSRWLLPDERRIWRAWCKTILTTLLYITSYNSFASSPNLYILGHILTRNFDFGFDFLMLVF